MSSYSIATTKDQLSALIDKANAGEEVVITNRGKPTARLVPMEPVAKRDVRAATELLRMRVKGAPSLGIPVERFRDWLYDDEDD